MESNRKRLGIGVSNLLSNVGDTERRVQQEVFGSLHATGEQVLLESGPHFLFEQHAEIIDRIMELVGEIEQGEILVQVIMNPCAHLFNERVPDGKAHLVVPRPSGMESSLPKTVTLLNGSAGWSDAAVILPWTLYQVYSDQRILEEQYASMKAWVDYQRRRNDWSSWSRRQGRTWAPVSSQRPISVQC